MTAKEKHLMKQLDKVRAENKILKTQINEVKKDRFKTETELLRVSNEFKDYKNRGIVNTLSVYEILDECDSSRKKEENVNTFPGMEDAMLRILKELNSKIFNY